MSRAVQALEAAELAPASRATLEDLIALHPPRFVPLECERRLQLKQDIERARAKHGWKKLDFKVFRKAAMTMPRAATTWVTTGMLRAMARQKEGLKRMHWLAEMIINAAPPRCRSRLRWAGHWS